MVKLFKIVVTALAIVSVTLPTASGAVDPTKPAVSKASMPGDKNTIGGELTLQSIFKRSTGYSAIISGKSYRVGDTLNEYTISKINPKNVVITDGRQQQTLRMYAYEIKK
ncbi:agglutinin biogenesis protein MshK [Alteromonas mediterranea]|uniref:agglutinin biogenesis protein MshK n=1 Tax=Alteromonas mediterranea TaxID=314275 RepID=UPI0009C00F96|nr:agglutinin biogenesis protein MshK [Alteromonas mediterranea]